MKGSSNITVPSIKESKHSLWVFSESSKGEKQLVTQVSCRSCQSGEGCSQRLTQFSALQVDTHVLIVLVSSYESTCKVHVRHALSLFPSLSPSLSATLIMRVAAVCVTQYWNELFCLVEPSITGSCIRFFFCLFFFILMMI